MPTASKRKKKRARGKAPSKSNTTANTKSKEAAKETAKETAKVAGSVPAEDRFSPEFLERLPWRSYGRVPLILLATFATIGGLYFAQAILFPMALAFVLYFLFAPIVRFMSRLHWMPESVSAAIVVLGVTLAIGLASYILAGPLSEWFGSAPETLQQAEQKLRFLIEPVGKIDEASEKVSEMADGSDRDGVIRVSIDQPPVSSYLMNATMSFLAGATITVALVYLLLAMGHRTLNSIVELMPTMKDKRGVVEMLRDVETGISGYLISVTMINAALGLIIGTVLGVLGFPDPLLLGIMAGTLNFIPFLGCVIGSAVTFLIGVVYLETIPHALAGSLAYLTINALEGNVITPMILGRSMRLNPPVVFISIVFWGWVWGIGGILIAVPLLGIGKIVCDHFDRLKPVAKLLSG